MDDPRLVNQWFKARFQANPNSKGKCCSHLLVKFLLIGLFLSFFPLFPTEPPEFISHTIFAQTWELIHLFIIGIVLSYGLFCSLKSSQISPKPQISQPHVPNILQHSSLFDYEEENTFGSFQKNVLPTRSFNISHYRTEPFVVVRRENCESFDERPLGLPVRSLRTRIVESDSGNSDDDDEGCDSESEYSGTPRSGKDQNLEENVGNMSSFPWNSRSMREDFLAENGKFDMNQLNSQSFRLPTQAPYQTNYGFCSWLPQSPNMDQYPVGIPPMAGLSSTEGGTSWRTETFEMPVSCFGTQGHGSNVMGMSPNLGKGNSGWVEGQFYVPATEVPSSMTAPTNGFDSRSRRYSHERMNLGEPSTVENEYSTAGRFGIFMPSARSSPLYSAPSKDFAPLMESSSFREFKKEITDMGMPPRFEHGNRSGEKTSFFMPSAAAAPSVSIPQMNFASSLEPSKANGLNHETRQSGISPISEHGILGSKEAGFSRPSPAAVSSVSVPERDFTSSMKPSRSRKLSNEVGELGVPPKFEHGNLGGEKVSSFVPTGAALSPVLAPEKDFGSSSKGSEHMKFIDKKDSGKSPNLQNGNLGGEKTSSFMPSATEPSSVSPSGKDTSSSVKQSRSTKLSRDNGDHGKLPNSQKENVGGENINEKISSFMPSAAEPSSESSPGKDIHSSIKQSRSRKFSQENEDQGKSLNSLEENFGVEKINPCRPSAAGSSVSASKKGCSQSMSQRVDPITSFTKEDSGKDNVGNLGQVDNLSSRLVDLPSMPPPRGDFTKSINESFLKTGEQRLSPTKWDDDCFEIPSPEHNSMGNVDKGNLSHELANSSSTGLSSRRSCTEKMSPQRKVGESVSRSLSANSSEIEEFGGDIDAYKPSTPSPPPQVQTRRNDFPSSVESSSNTLSNVSLLEDDNDLGSPPTPERGRALSRRSHSLRFSCTSFFDRDQRRGFKDDHAKEANRKINKRGNSCGWDCLKLDMKPNLSKAALKGKSVRTIRPPETPLHCQRELSEGDEKREENGGTSMGMTGERKGEKPGMVVIHIGISDKKPNSSNGGKGDQKQGSGTTSIIVGLNSKESSEVAATDVKEEEADSDEIDRKAGEFIAKFKEQMRLQKVAARAESSRARQQQPQRNSPW